MNKKLLITIAGISLLILISITLLLLPRKSKQPVIEIAEPTPTFIPSLAPGETREIESKPPVGAYQESLKQYKTEEPDFYLAQFISSLDPYTALTFTIQKEFKTTPTNHFGYIITLKGTDKVQARRDAVDWLRSKNLTDEQILKLDITYKNE